MTGAPSWPPYHFDLTDPDGPGLDTRVELPLLIDYFAHEATHTTDWRLDDDSKLLVRLAVLDRQEHRARIAFSAGGREGAIALEADPSGWLRVEVSMNGAEVFRAFVDRPYEEYELWPPAAEKANESPGHMGKRRNWLSLHADTWPVLRPIANAGGWVNLKAMEYMTIHVRLLNQGADAWRPVQAIPGDYGFELIAPEAGIPAGEMWEFSPGASVRCEMRKLSGEDEVVAVALTEPTGG